MWLLHYTENLPSLAQIGHVALENIKAMADTFLATLSGLKRSCQQKAITLWQSAKPKLDKLMQATLAIFAAANAFRMTVQFAPIVLSIITVLAAAPLFSFVLPQFLFAPSFILPSLLCISLFAGYFKYTELVLRAKLDAQTENNRLAIEALSLQMEAGKESIKKLQTSCQILQARVSELEHNMAPIVPLLDLKKNKSPSPPPSEEIPPPMPGLQTSALLLSAH